MSGGAGQDSGRFDRVTVLFHWLSAALVVGQFATAWARALTAGGGEAASLLTLHRSAGVVLWALTIGRLVWRGRWGRRRPLPPTIPALQHRLARANTWALYALLGIQPLTGLAQELLRGKPFPLFFGRMPTVVARHRELAHLFHEIHEKGAWLLLALILAHAVAALGHHFILRDGVLAGMAPRIFSRGGNKPRPATVLADVTPSNRTPGHA